MSLDTNYISDENIAHNKHRRFSPMQRQGIPFNKSAHARQRHAYQGLLPYSKSENSIHAGEGITRDKQESLRIAGVGTALLLEEVCLFSPFFRPLKLHWYLKRFVHPTDLLQWARPETVIRKQTKLGIPHMLVV